MTSLSVKYGVSTYLKVCREMQSTITFGTKLILRSIDHFSKSSGSYVKKYISFDLQLLSLCCSLSQLFTWSQGQPFLLPRNQHCHSLHARHFYSWQPCGRIFRSPISYSSPLLLRMYIYTYFLLACIIYVLLNNTIYKYTFRWFSIFSILLIILPDRKRCCGRQCSLPRS